VVGVEALTGAAVAGAAVAGAAVAGAAVAGAWVAGAAVVAAPPQALNRILTIMIKVKSLVRIPSSPSQKYESNGCLI
jgi:hypothetical protein